jgi:hypothetical protein
MTTTLVETSRRDRRARCPEVIGRHIPAEPVGLTGTFDARRRLDRIVHATALVPGVELLSASLDPSDGSMRIELLAPMLSAPERLSLEAELRSTAVPDASTSGMIAFEFVDSALS